MHNGTQGIFYNWIKSSPCLHMLNSCYEHLGLIVIVDGGWSSSLLWLRKLNFWICHKIERACGIVGYLEIERACDIVGYLV